MSAAELLYACHTLPPISQNIPHGDMPGDKICIEPEHIRKAATIFDAIKQPLAEKLSANPKGRAVLCVCGGSGVGKSEIASVLGYYLNSLGIGAYILSGDNYPHRIPEQNDAERLRVYRAGGLKGLVDSGLYANEQNEALRRLWENDRDVAPVAAPEWLAAYQHAGRQRLAAYLGTPSEIDFDEVNGILAAFHNGAPAIVLKRMGRKPDELWYETISFTATQVLIIEWTHGNSDYLQGVDLPILLNSTPAETLAHRQARNRDGKTDSDFTRMVLALEQQKLDAQAGKAALILSKAGEILSFREYRKIMAEELEQ